MRLKRSSNSDRVGRVYPCIAQYPYCIVAGIVRIELRGRRLEVLDTTNLVLVQYSCIFLTPKSVSKVPTEKVYPLGWDLRQLEGVDGYQLLH